MTAFAGSTIAGSFAAAAAALWGLQDAEATAPRAAGWTAWLYEFGRQPGVVEVALAVTVLGLALFTWWRISGLVAGARSRAALGDYLLGIEQALQGDPAGARKRLEAVVAQDPENHFARLMLAKVLTELGEPARANLHHVYLQSAFGIDSKENELLLAECLLAAGQVREAAATAEAALEGVPARADAWEFVYRTRLRGGEFDAAARAGRRLLALRGGVAAQPWLAKEVARIAAEAGLQRLGAGDLDGARAALQSAKAVHRDADAVKLLAARLDARDRGVEVAVEDWLALVDAPGAAALPVAVVKPTAVPAAVRAVAASAAAALPVAAAPWRCGACAAPLAYPDLACAACGATGAARPEEPALLTEIGSAMQCMDAIDENEAYVRRLCQSALGDDDAAAAAKSRRTVLTMGERAVPELLSQAWHGDERRRAAAVDVLRAMGPSIAPALFAASDALADAKLLPIGPRSPAALVGLVVQGFDRQALPHVQSLFSSARPEHRKILIDYFLGLADMGEFQLVLSRFPPHEILHRLNRCDGVVLRRFLAAIPPQHYLAEVLLLEANFAREEELLAALPQSAHPEVLERVLVRRGPSRSLVRALLSRLLDAEYAELAPRVLVALGEPVLDHLVPAFSDPEAATELRTALERVLVRFGAATARRLADAFGPEPTAIDDRLRAVLVAIGGAAAEPLAAAYSKSSWMEKFTAGLLDRHNNRRVQIVLSLQAIGGAPAIDCLQRLRGDERDANLRLRLEKSLFDLGQPSDGANDGGRDG